MINAIDELTSLCKILEEENGEKTSFFHNPVSEEEMIKWKTGNRVKIPATYKEWLRFTGECKIDNNAAIFLGIIQVSF